MPMTPAEMEHKVLQLDNDVQAIYEMLAAIDGTLRRHENRFKEMSAQLGDVQTQLTEHGRRLDGIDGRLDGIDGKLDTVLELLQAR